MTQVKAENKMGVMSINKLLLNMSLPMMISMLVMAFYNVVDSIFVAQLGEAQLTAVSSLSFPAQSLTISIMMGTGVGYSALVSRYLGAKQQGEANNIATHAVFLSLIIYLLFAAAGLFAVKPFFRAQTDDMEIYNYGVSYLRICLLCSFGQCFEVVFEKLLQATGKTVYSMITQGIGAVINIVLDPVLIFGLGPFPQMGVNGAAVATVAGQIVAGIFAFLFCHFKNHEIHISFHRFRPQWNAIKKIYAIGIPSIIMQSIGSVMTFCMNKILMIFFNSTAVAVFGVYFKMQSIVFMPVFGLNNGMVPIIAFNFGAANMERVRKTMRLALIYALGIMLAGLLIVQFFPGQILGMFNASETMLAIGIPALRIISLSFLMAAVGIVSSSVMQALGNSIPSMIVSIARQLVILIPAAWLLALPGNVNLVWLAFPIAEIVSFFISIGFLKRELKRADRITAENRL